MTTAARGGSSSGDPSFEQVFERFFERRVEATVERQLHQLVASNPEFAARIEEISRGMYGDFVRDLATHLLSKSKSGEATAEPLNLFAELAREVASQIGSHEEDFVDKLAQQLVAKIEEMPFNPKSPFIQKIVDRAAGIIADRLVEKIA